ncbi:ImmA/IrrE family metallo-endopeptidase [uncultured Methylophaga sp.]|uniref:ImmA/IrrE family metallo-endopeptidase n=1 Tax=uncultured Methylophaga sp. TaxID=285271 RepID=UPI00262D16E4|nr:ImmA/IrrE family metallo-endopeptidase [uncultured Methylophaga sp.]
MELKTFTPDWTSAPGDTISQILDLRNISLKSFSKMLGIKQSDTRKLLKGEHEINNELALKLSSNLGASQDFWINREQTYRCDLERLRESEIEKKRWLESLPVRDMVKFGWIEKSTNFQNKIASCLAYFGATSIDRWYTKYNYKLSRTAFRTSTSFDSSPESIVTWLRQGEIRSQERELKPWSKEKLQDSLEKIKSLSRDSEPSSFIPKLQNIFSECGVALVILPTPTKCRASGATFFNEDDHPIMLLSFRYLSDDQFWFTLFHEVGHLLLHGQDRLFIEGDGFITEAEEEEANKFSENTLIPQQYKDEFFDLNSKDWKKIPRFAKKLGISPGIVVGQMQHYEFLDKRYFNKMKVRYNRDEIASLS